MTGVQTCALPISSHAVSQLQNTPDQATWQWDNGAYRLTARLQQRDLALTINAREPGELALLRQPAEAMGRGLIWPLAEGHYVPAGNAIWKTFLLERGEFNTTQDLSLPLWGVDHGGFTLSWLLTNPYNNRLRWQDDMGIFQKLHTVSTRMKIQMWELACLRKRQLSHRCSD